jgi:hypothetical protein
MKKRRGARTLGLLELLDEGEVVEQLVRLLVLGVERGG